MHERIELAASTRRTAAVLVVAVAIFAVGLAVDVTALLVMAAAAAGVAAHTLRRRAVLDADGVRHHTWLVPRRFRWTDARAVVVGRRRGLSGPSLVLGPSALDRVVIDEPTGWRVDTAGGDPVDAAVAAAERHGVPVRPFAVQDLAWQLALVAVAVAALVVVVVVVVAVR